jgi:Glycosyl transferases group 1
MDLSHAINGRSESARLSARSPDIAPAGPAAALVDSRCMGGQPVRILSTLFSTDPPIPLWQERVATLRPAATDAVTVGQLLIRAQQYDALVLDGSARRDQLAAALLRSRGGGPAVVIADATWKVPHRAGAAWGKRLAMRLIDDERTTFGVLSRFEADRFALTWRLRRSRVRFTPWPVTLVRPDLMQESTDNGRVFAGGNSLRDYRPLIDAAGEIGAPVDIATSTLDADDARRYPANVTARSFARADYDAMLRAASVVVVPLEPRTDRSSGQTTYVNAMALGKAIVVTDAPGVRDYIDDGDTGVIVPCGDAAALASAVRALLSDRQRRQCLGERARRHALTNLTLSGYAERLLRLVDETLAAPTRRTAVDGAAG